MKKTLVFLAILVLIAAISVGGTIAYYNAEEVVHNVITTGGVELEIVEQQDDGEGGLEPFENDQTGIMPGADVEKIVTISNTGESGAYVRLAVEVTMTLAEGKEGSPDLSLIELDYNTEKWTKQGDFWYYNEELPGGESTEPLFTKVSFSEDMDNLYQGCKTEVIVSAQAVQSANNGSSALEATGWPEA